MRVVQIPMVEVPRVGGGTIRLPDIPAASLIKKEGRSGYYSVHFGAKHQRWVMLYRFGPGWFVATRVSHAAIWDRLPDGPTWLQFLRSPVGRAWRHWRIRRQGEARDERVRLTQDVPEADATDGAPWNHEGMTITRARPTLPSVCGARPRDFLRDVEVTRD